MQNTKESIKEQLKAYYDLFVSLGQQIPRSQEVPPDLLLDIISGGYVFGVAIGSRVVGDTIANRLVDFMQTGLQSLADSIIKESGEKISREQADNIINLVFGALEKPFDFSEDMQAALQEMEAYATRVTEYKKAEPSQATKKDVGYDVIVLPEAQAQAQIMEAKDPATTPTFAEVEAIVNKPARERLMHHLKVGAVETLGQTRPFDEVADLSIREQWMLNAIAEVIDEQY